MKKFLLALLFVTSSVGSLLASDTPTLTLKKDDPLRGKRRFGAGISITTVGLGAFGAYKINPHFSARLGASYFAYRQPLSVKPEKTSEGNVNIQPDLTIGMAQAIGRYYPWTKRPFFVSAGLAYTWRPDVRTRVSTDGTIEFGGIQMEAEDVGTIDLALRWQHLLGYGGLGYGWQVPNRRFGVNVELGTYYLGKPQIDLKYEGFLETTTIDQQIPTIEKNLSGYRWLPSFQIHLIYAIR